LVVLVELKLYIVRHTKGVSILSWVAERELGVRLFVDFSEGIDSEISDAKRCRLALAAIPLVQVGSREVIGVVNLQEDRFDVAAKPLVLEEGLRGA
jgi:hypothetical protein